MTAGGSDDDSGIVGYAFSKDNGATWTAQQESAVYTFSNLTTGAYEIKVRAFNNAGLYTDSTKVIANTTAIITPTYSINLTGWTTSKVVTIDYQTSGYTKQYSIDGGTSWITSTGQTQTVTFNNNGSVIARVTDGVNTIIASTYNVTQVDPTAPTSSIASLGTITSKSIVVIASGVDEESGIVGYAFSKDIGTTWTAAQASNSYTYENLTTGTYQIKVKVYNDAGLTLDSSAVSATTATIVTPTYSITPTGWAPSKTVTIDYQTSGYTKQYSIDGGTTWTTSAAQTQTVTFTAAGSVIAKVTDGVNTITASTYNVTQIDTVAPTIAFGTNGNATYAKSQSTTVTVSDTGGAGVDAASLEYLWSTATSGIVEANFTSTFTNGGTLTQSGVTGGYYLWILAKDAAGNTTITKSNVFNLDNTGPVITITGSNPVNVTRTLAYTDAGATATDAISGARTVTTTNPVNTATAGAYTVTYSATDAAGNTTTATRTVNVQILFEYLIVGGGGGGIGDDVSTAGGGGGAGGLVTGSTVQAAGSYAVTVGGGGAGGYSQGGTTTPPYSGGANGGDSSIFGIIGMGGGGGGVRKSGGSAGGSGGGGSVSGNGGASIQASTYGYGLGYKGGDYLAANNSTGGGGAGGAGGNPTSTSQGIGGAGYTSSITGAAVCYAGGGGAGGTTGAAAGYSGTRGTATCGGGAGGVTGTSSTVCYVGTAGTANTGGGGGGGSNYSVAQATPLTFGCNGGAGGSGIVIVRYLGTAAKGTGGTVTVSGGYVIHKFTASGTFAPTN